MKRLATAVIAVIASACATAPAPVAAQVALPDGGDPPTLHVSANATVQRTPDRAVIQLAVETLAPTAGEASDQNAALMEAVLAAVRRAGVPSSGIRTQRLELQPRYDNRRDAEPTITGYRALNQVTLRIDDIGIVGAVVDAGVRAGANRVTGIHFELVDPEAAYHDALREAIAKARAEAEVAASALGMRLAGPLNVSTGGFSPPMPYGRMEAVAMDEARAAPPVEPGEVDVRATVSITWRLET